jgi:hypothetical protein
MWHYCHFVVTFTIVDVVFINDKFMVINKLRGNTS